MNKHDQEDLTELTRLRWHVRNSEDILRERRFRFAEAHRAVVAAIADANAAADALEAHIDLMENT